MRWPKFPSSKLSKDAHLPIAYLQHLLLNQPITLGGHLLNDFDAVIGQFIRTAVVVTQIHDNGKGNYKAYNTIELSRKSKEYFSSLEVFFRGVQDPTDWRQLPQGENPDPTFRAVIAATAKLSGLNDRRTDPNGNDYYVEHEEIFG